MTWERKLASADAPVEGRLPEDSDGGQEGELHADCRTCPRSSGTVRGGGGSAERHDDGERGGAQGGVVAQPLPDGDAPEPGGDDRGAEAEGGGAPGDAGSEQELLEDNETTAPGELAAVGADRDDGPPAGSGQWPLAGASAGERSDAAPKKAKATKPTADEPPDGYDRASHADAHDRTDSDVDGGGARHERVDATSVGCPTAGRLVTAGHPRSTAGCRPLDPQTEAQVEDLVRVTRGLAGAESLSHGVVGVSRRTAAGFKAETLTAMERERRARCTSVDRHGARSRAWL